MIGRRAQKIDANQPDIVDALRKAGASVEFIGKPVDLVIAYNGVNIMVEVKDGAKPPSAQNLTPDQIKFFANWKGPAFIVRSVDDALQIIKSLQVCDNGQNLTGVGNDREIQASD